MSEKDIGHWMMFVGAGIAFGNDSLTLKIIGGIMILVGEVLYEWRDE